MKRIGTRPCSQPDDGSGRVPLIHETCSRKACATQASQLEIRLLRGAFQLLSELVGGEEVACLQTCSHSHRSEGLASHINKVC